MEIFTGAGVALVTPFRDDFSIDYDKLDEIIDFHCENHTDSIVVCGTSGEASTLTEQEHMDCIRFTVERTRGRIPVIAGTGSNCTRTAMELSGQAAECGVDGVLVVTPYYNKATQDGLIAHFTQVAQAAGVPMLMYHIPGRTGVTMKPETIAYLVRNVENIVGVKEASGDLSAIAKIMSLTDGQIDLYSGNDDQIVPILSLGGKGVISVLSNVAPRETHDICSLYMEGNVQESRELQLRALPLIEALFCEVNPIPVKKAVELLGLCRGVVRAPLTELEAEHVQQLESAMKHFGILQ